MSTYSNLAQKCLYQETKSAASSIISQIQTTIKLVHSEKFSVLTYIQNSSVLTS